MWKEKHFYTFLPQKNQYFVISIQFTKKCLLDEIINHRIDMTIR